MSKKKQHVWHLYKRLTWPVCARCGLVALKNAATRKAIGSPCEGLEDE